MRHGQGKYVWPNGSSFTGEFSHDNAVFDEGVFLSK
jgi:hypothetical protein